MKRFTLDIDLGNEAMKSPEDIALALEQVAQHICDGPQTGSPILDDNGSRVGYWEII